MSTTSISDPPDPQAGGTRSRWFGLCLLGALLGFSAVWLYLQGRGAPVVVAPPTTSALTRALTGIDLTRFRSDAWQLPDESLLGFVEIPEGSFLMGSDPEVDSMAYANERWSSASRQGRVSLPTFLIGRYEVTVAQLAVFATATGYSLDPRALQLPPDHPATYVSWTDALAYARWLQATLLDSPGTPVPLMQLLNAGWQITLPSEAEWERAARGNDGRIYPWGAVPDTTFANFAGSSTRAVGSRVCPDCAFGLADISGNVWELTRSPNQPYPFDPSDRPADTEAAALFVMRGGAFNEGANNVRGAVRGGIDPGARRSFVGFRLVLTPALREV